MPPSTDTLDIPELLETILENALPQDLLLWQRVNKTWQAANQQSPRIQEKLFFRIKRCKDKHEQMPMVLNPLFDILLGGSLEEVTRLGLLIPTNTFDGKASYPTASWKQMFLTSPAITEMSVALLNQSTWDNKAIRPIVCDSGVTIGQLADNLKEKIAHDTENTDLAVIWPCKLDLL